MKRLLVLLLVAALFSGCIGQQKIQQTVKNGDMISVDYIGRIEGGNVFDSSIESVAKQNNVYNQGRKYQPLNLTVGKGQVIKGFDNGVIGMKIGETKTLTIPPEQGYGPIDPNKISVIPIVQSIPAKTTISKIVEIPAERFNSIFGPNHIVGDKVNIPNTNINLTVNNISAINDSLAYNLVVGDKILQKGAPWNETVTSVNEKNITIKVDAKKGDIVHLPNIFWNSTVIDINDTNVTLRHEAIPDQEIPMQFGSVRIHFNETSITIDQNNNLAGKTLIFDVTLKSINSTTAP